jgi:hypothetical protein
MAISRKEGKMSNQHCRPTDYQMISRGVELLRFGILVRDLSGRLRDEFWLTPERARELAGEAEELYKKPKRQSKVDTKPFNQPA